MLVSLPVEGAEIERVARRATFSGFPAPIAE